MRDFKALVCEHLASLDLPGETTSKIVEELAAQMGEAYDALVARGLSDEDAWQELQRQVPDWTALRDALLDAEPAVVRFAHPARGPLAGATKRALMSDVREVLGRGVIRDLQSIARRLIRDRGFTATTILTLAVCLGANVAIFTVVYGVLLRPLPVHEADRIVAMGDVYPTAPDDNLFNTAPSYFDRIEAVTALGEQAMFAPWFDTILSDATSEEHRGMRTTPSLFRLLGVSPALGRAFTEAEGEFGDEKKIILSDGLWRRLYGADPLVIGKDLRLGWTGDRYTIVGVMPRGFSFFDRGDDGHARSADDAVQFWIPLAFTEAQKSVAARTRYGFFHIGRLRPGATIDHVQAQVNALNLVNTERFPELRLAQQGVRTVVTPLQVALTRSVSRILYLLWGGAAFLLLIGALNIANLSLARSRARAREMATRLALGAGGLRVTRHLVLEGVMVATIGGLASVAIAHAILRTLVFSGMASIPNAASVEIDATVIGFTMTVSVLVGVLMGLVPAVTVSRLNVNQVLTDGSRFGTAGRAARLFRQGLVVTQVALSVVLLIGAGLLLTSFRHLLAVDAGFRAERVTTATIFPPPSRYQDQAALATLSSRMLDAVRSIPGVEAAGLTSNIPLSGQGSPSTVTAADRPSQPYESLLLPSVVSVTPGYFEAMGTPLLRGRAFADSDHQDAQPVAIVDERLADRLWPNEDPIGKDLQRGDAKRYSVVGVVRNVRFEGLARQVTSGGTAYFPNAQTPVSARLRWIAVKTRTASTAVVRSLRSALATIDPGLPLSDIQTMTQRTAASVVPQKLAMGLASAFGVVALLLSALGIYGVLSYVVAQRTREIGIRIALGSTARNVFRLVFNEGLALVSGGMAFGLLGALALGRVLEGQVFGVKPTDPFVIGIVAMSTAIVALLACVSPARRATRVDPLKVLSDQ